MRPYIHAALLLALSIAITALIMVVVFPVHALGGASPTAAGSDVIPAVFVEGEWDMPNDSGPIPTCPFLAEGRTGTRCPYLAGFDAGSDATPDMTRRAQTPVERACPGLSAFTAASRCPALSVPAPGSSCPFLGGVRSHDPPLWGHEDDPAATTFSL
jgi:hypothetical protein